MNNEVTEIINTLCEKLGVTVDILVPEMARYYIARLTFLTLTETIFAIILGIAFARIVRWILCKMNTYWEDKIFLAFFTNMFLGMSLIFLILSAFSDASDLIGWIASPTASAVREIMKLIK